MNQTGLSHKNGNIIISALWEGYCVIIFASFSIRFQTFNSFNSEPPILQGGRDEAQTHGHEGLCHGKACNLLTRNKLPQQDTERLVHDRKPGNKIRNLILVPRSWYQVSSFQTERVWEAEPLINWAGRHEGLQVPRQGSGELPIFFPN